MKIGILILERYKEIAGKLNHYDQFHNFGIHLIEDVIKRNLPGAQISYCSMVNINDFDVVLVSLTSINDVYNLVYTFMKRGVKAKDIKPTLILGGAGCLNVKTYEDYADVFVFGRGELSILEILNQIESVRSKTSIENSEFWHIRNNEFTNKTIRQSETVYPYELSGKTEKMYGCPNCCYFCQYRFSREYHKVINNNYEMSGMVEGSSEEDFENLNIRIKMPYYTTGIDGYSQRLRFAVNKKISNQDIIEKFKKIDEENIDPEKWKVIKFYMICGYPTESIDDYSEFITVCSELSLLIKNMKLAVELLNTPFSPEPTTPMQYEKADCNTNFRDYFDKFNFEQFRTDNFHVTVRWGINAPFTHFKRLLVNRGDKSDQSLLEFVTFNKKFNNTRSDHQINYLKKNYKDYDKFVRQYEIGESMSSDYLQSYTKRDLVLKLAGKCRNALYS